MQTSLGDKTTVSVWDMKDTNGDGKISSKDGVTVKSGNVIKLLKIMEADAKAAGATKLVLEGKAIMNTKLLNVQAWERLGYTVENVAETSIKVSKKL